MDSEEWRSEIRERLARLEEAVDNHIPTRLARIEKSIDALGTKLWGLIAGVLLVALGLLFQVYGNFRGLYN